MNTSKITYQGDLRTQCTHLRSGNQFITDAPVDNNGKGEAFSPTDTVATALASCMLTIMGIRSNKHGLNIDGSNAEVLKVMGSDPRRISEIHIKMQITDRGLSQANKELLEDAALNCPVAKSLNASIVQDVEFQYISTE